MAAQRRHSAARADARPQTHTMPGLNVGQEAPDFTLPGSWGEDVTLSKVLVRAGG